MEGRIAPPGKLNVKTSPPLSIYFGLSIHLVFNRLFFACFGAFSGDFVFQYRHPHPDSLSFLKFFF